MNDSIESKSKEALSIYEFEKQKVINFKQQLSEIMDILSKQKEELHQTKLITDAQSLKLINKQKELKSLSFNSVISRPPFLSAPKRKNYFDEKLLQIFMDTGKALDFSEREALIFPDKVKAHNLKDYYSNPCGSVDFAKVFSKKESQKSLEFKSKWESNYSKLREEDLLEMRKKEDGTLKNKIWKEKLENLKKFIPPKFSLDYFQKDPSYISDDPKSPRTIQRMISLDRLYEKKNWNPTKKKLDLFEKPTYTKEQEQDLEILFKKYDPENTNTVSKTSYNALLIDLLIGNSLTKDESDSLGDLDKNLIKIAIQEFVSKKNDTITFQEIIEDVESKELLKIMTKAYENIMKNLNVNELESGLEEFNNIIKEENLEQEETIKNEKEKDHKLEKKEETNKNEEIKIDL